MSTFIIILVFVSILFSVATYSVVKNKGGEPVGWAIGMFLAWPVLAPIVAARYKTRPLLTGVVLADVLLVLCLAVAIVNSRAARLEKQSITNLHELGQALTDYTGQHKGQLPAKIDDLVPYLRRQPVGSELPPAMVSPFATDPGLLGYQLMIPRPFAEDSNGSGVMVQDLPADALVIKDIHAPASMRIGIYADGTVRSY